MSEEQIHEESPAAANDPQPSGEDSSELAGYAYLFTRANLLIGGGVLLMLFVFLVFLFYNIGLSQGRLRPDGQATTTPVALLVGSTATAAPQSATAAPLLPAPSSIPPPPKRPHRMQRR